MQKKGRSHAKKNLTQLHVVAIQVEPHQSNGPTKPIRNDFFLEIIQPHLYSVYKRSVHVKKKTKKTHIPPQKNNRG